VRLQHKILQLEEDNTKLLGNNEGIKIEYEKLNDYTTELYAAYRVSIKDIKREKDNYRDITQKLKKYTIANTEMYNLLDYILQLNFSRTISDRIEYELIKVDKLVKPVYRGDTQETPNKL
jgi:hypothetical protein